MLRFIKGFFAKPIPPEAQPVAPYKVEAPEHPSVNWPFPRASEIAPEPALVVATSPARKPRAPARPKAAPAEKPVVLKKPRVKKTPAN